ncbi:MAG: ABC transporter permease [Bryobacteraceae bacterium]|jgi:ABC-2 type transport system permease protein/lipopolysaccharide transport system permease protein
MSVPFITNADRFPVPVRPMRNWTGDYWYLIENLVLKDFKIRYRNMSLGVFWSLINPLVMMSVLWFVFTRILPNGNIPHYALFVLCGLVPFNVFTMCWLNGTISLIDNAHLIKRVPVPREAIPVAAVLANCLQLVAQVLLLLFLAAATMGIHRSWFWLLAIWPFEVLFVTGLALMFSAFDVYVRDVRYVVESTNVVLFWLVPIVYDFRWIPTQYRVIYAYNPVAAMVMALRNILLDQTAPAGSLLAKAAISSVAMFLLGLAVFRRLRPRFYNFL